MEKESREISRILRLLRVNRGLSQEAVAKVLGISRPAYSYYETGKSLPGLAAIRKLAEFYGVSADVFIYPERFGETER